MARARARQETRVVATMLVRKKLVVKGKISALASVASVVVVMVVVQVIIIIKEEALVTIFLAPISMTNNLLDAFVLSLSSGIELFSTSTTLVE